MPSSDQKQLSSSLTSLLNKVNMRLKAVEQRWDKQWMEFMLDFIPFLSWKTKKLNVCILSN